MFFLISLTCFAHWLISSLIMLLQGLGLDDSFDLVKETKVPSNVSGGDKQVPTEVPEVGKVVTNPGVPYKDMGDSSKSTVRPSLQDAGSSSNPLTP